MPGIFDIIRMLIVLSGMIYASYQDWIKREVEDYVWIICGAVGGGLTAIDLVIIGNINLWILTAISIALSSGLALAFYYFGLYGGADAKAIVVISLGLPLYNPPMRLHPFTGLASLSNGLMLSLALLVILFLWNVMKFARGEKIFEGFEHEKWYRKVAATFFGVRLKDARKREFWFPIEEEVNGKRFFKFGLFELELEEISRDDCWATPGIPLLIFITGGFLAYLLLGDFLRVIIDLIAAI